MDAMERVGLIVRRIGQYDFANWLITYQLHS